MDKFTREDLQALLEQQEVQPCLSVILPTHRLGPEVQQNRLRFRNLLKEAGERLGQFGFSGSEANALLAEAQDRLLPDEDFWQHQSDGLAVFISPQMFRSYRLPLDFDELVYVGEHFYIRPLAEALQHEVQFYVLALARDNVWLLEGSRAGLEEVSPERMPASLADELNRVPAEEQDESQQVSRPRLGDRGRGEAAFHGHGVGNDDEQGQLLQYFHRVDHGIGDFLSGSSTPLVLAGVEYLFPIYRLSNDYPHLMEEGVSGSADDITRQELHARALEIVRQRSNGDYGDAAALYQRLDGKETGRASKDLEQVIQSAYSGRVGQLFIPHGETIWGRYDRADNRVEVHGERRPESEDLLNTAAVFTLANNGVVYAGPVEQMPEQALIAAIYRY